MASIAKKIAEAKSISELDDLVRNENLTDVEEGFLFDRLCFLATNGCPVSQAETGEIEEEKEEEEGK